MTEWIPVEEWATIVRNMPIPSVDLVVIDDDGILLAKRANEPAKGEWFVPGGRIRKNESIEAAVHRVADQELGIEVDIVEELGAFDHFYDVSDFEGVSKHYVAHGFVVEPLEEELELDDQHHSVRSFEKPPADLHEHVVAYLRKADSISFY